MKKENVIYKVIAKAWQDDAFKDQLLKNPEKTLKEAGFEIPEGKKVIVKQNTDKEFFFVLPRKPEGELTAQELEAIAGGVYTEGELPLYQDYAFALTGYADKTPVKSSGYQVD